MVFDSVYEMTDYLKSPTIAPTVTVSDDFSSTSGWTQNDSAKIGLDTTSLRFISSFASQDKWTSISYFRKQVVLILLESGIQTFLNQESEVINQADFLLI